MYIALIDDIRKLRGCLNIGVSGMSNRRSIFVMWLLESFLRGERRVRAEGGLFSSWLIKQNLPLDL